MSAIKSAGAMLFVAAIYCSAVAVFAQEQASVQKEKTPIMSKFENARGEALATVDAIASHNPAPKIVGTNPRTPLFDERFDWSEYKRVWEKAVPKAIDRAENAWPELVKHIGDQRYAITLGNDNGAFNWTVGDMCRTIVAETLTAACLQAVRPDSKSDQVKCVPEMVRDDEKLKSWCEHRESKPVYELQMEMCELAIAQMSQSDESSPPTQELQTRVDALKAEIRSLRESKRVVPFRGFGSEAFDLYSAEKANKLREQLQGQGKG